MALFRSRGHSQELVSTRELTEGRAGAVNALAAVVSVVLVGVTKNPAWLGVGVGAPLVTGTVTAAVAHMNKRVRYMQDLAARISKPTTKSHTASSRLDVGYDTGSPVGSFAAVIGGSTIKGIGSDPGLGRPTRRIRQAVTAAGHPLDLLDVAAVRSGLGDLSRQQDRVHKVLERNPRYANSELDVLVIAPGYTEIGATDPPYDIEKYLRSILNESLGDPRLAGVFKIAEGGAHVVIVPPSTCEEVLVPAGEKVPKGVRQLWRDRAERYNAELAEVVNDYLGEYATDRVTLLPPGRTVGWDPKLGLYTPPHELAAMEGQVRDTILAALRSRGPARRRESAPPAGPDTARGRQVRRVTRRRVQRPGTS